MIGPTLRFPVVFLALLIGFTAAAHSPWALREVRDPLCSALARAVSALLGLLGERTVVAGTTIHASGGGIDIAYDCDGVALMGLFLAAALAFPRPAGRLVLPGLLLALATITAANVLRLASLAWIYIHHRPLFEVAHVYVFQGLLLLVTLVAWLVWAGAVQSVGTVRAAR